MYKETQGRIAIAVTKESYTDLNLEAPNSQGPVSFMAQAFAAKGRPHHLPLIHRQREGDTYDYLLLEIGNEERATKEETRRRETAGQTEIVEQRERHTERQRETYRERQTEREKERDRGRERNRERDRQREREKEREIELERERDTEKTNLNGAVPGVFSKEDSPCCESRPVDNFSFSAGIELVQR